MYYIFLENNKLNGCGQCKILNEDIENIEVPEDVYNAYSAEPNKYIYSTESIEGVEAIFDNIYTNPNYEAELQKQEQERIGKLYMTRYDFYKYIVAPSGITYDQLEEIVNSNSDMKAAWNLCGNVYRGDTTLCENIKNYIPTMTDELLTAIFEQFGKQGE